MPDLSESNIETNSPLIGWKSRAIDIYALDIDSNSDTPKRVMLRIWRRQKKQIRMDEGGEITNYKLRRRRETWIPACAGMTGGRKNDGENVFCLYAGQ